MICLCTAVFVLHLGFCIHCGLKGSAEIKEELSPMGLS